MIAQPPGARAVGGAARPVQGRPVANAVALTPIAVHLSIGPVMALALFVALGATYGGPLWPSCGARLVATEPSEFELWWTKQDKSLDGSNQYTTGCSADDLSEILINPFHRFFHHLCSGRWWAPSFTDDEMARIELFALAQQGQIRIDRFLKTATWYQLLGAAVDYLAWGLLWLFLRLMRSLIAATEANNLPPQNHPVWISVSILFIGSAALFVLNSATFWLLPYYMLLLVYYPVMICLGMILMLVKRVLA